jgi:hypothetical protein
MIFVETYKPDQSDPRETNSGFPYSSSYTFASTTEQE